MFDGAGVQPQYSAQELEWLREMGQRSGVQIADDQHHYPVGFNALRWCRAYGGDVETASRKFRRHLLIRRILRLDEGIDEEAVDVNADHYAPMHFLGNNSTDQRPVFLEQSGLFDLGSMMSQIRITPFMANRFRLMERILTQIRQVELITGTMSGAVLVIDLEGLKFQSNLVGFISGTYRIMWGTLMEQYPYMFSKFLIINAPTFMNVLWSACQSFIPAEYRAKIHLLKNHSEFHSHVDPSILPHAYGGSNIYGLKKPTECRVPQIAAPENSILTDVCVPAGKSIVQTYYLQQNECIEFYLRSSNEFTMNIFYSPSKRTIMDPMKDVEEMEEVFAGCERPAISTLDSWKWTTPYAGFYHVIYGNEKAWIMSIALEYQMFQVHPNGNRVKVNPIPN